MPCSNDVYLHAHYFGFVSENGFICHCYGNIVSAWKHPVVNSQSLTFFTASLLSTCVRHMNTDWLPAAAALFRLASLSKSHWRDATAHTGFHYPAKCQCQSSAWRHSKVGGCFRGRWSGGGGLRSSQKVQFYYISCCEIVSCGSQFYEAGRL